MKLILKEIGQKVIPKPFHKRLIGVWNIYSAIGIRRAVLAVENAKESNQWLGLKDLEVLNSKYKKPKKYSYDPETTRKRGIARATEILTVLKSVTGLGDIQSGYKSLELGALDAMVSLHLQKNGFRTTAIDLADSHFAPDTAGAGVDLHVMDAADLKFKDGDFDLVFSYNSFEHFDDPEKVLVEALRVLRPGGYLYANFAPLYPSPFGHHGYESIPIPYMHFLFPREILENFCADNDLGTIEFDNMNGWSAGRFHELWLSYSDKMEKERYTERLDSYGIELIIKYPECFKGKIRDPKDFFVSGIEGLWRRK